MTGAFGSAALDLHARGLAVIPTGGEDGKTPLVRGWGSWKGQRRPTVEMLTRRYEAANVAVLTGPSRLTVIDCDDERTLADAEGRFGPSPLVTRSPRGGGHLYYRSAGERNANLRAFGLNVDVRGAGGIVLAPPSVRSGVGLYRIERGRWDDLPNLPAVAPGAIPARGSAQATERRQVAHAEGMRNESLFLALRHCAELFDTLGELENEAHAINAQFSPPLPPPEATKVARSVWRMKSEGRIILPGQQRLLMRPSELDGLNADAFYLLAWIKRWHGAKHGKPFALSTKAMQKAEVVAGWGRRRYAMAIGTLRREGYLCLVHKGGRAKGDVSLFCMGARNGPNVTRHPRRAPPRLNKGESMTEERMYDLTIKPLAAGGLELLQGEGPEDPSVIYLHPAQVRRIAELAGTNATARHVERVRELVWNVEFLDAHYGGGIEDRCTSGVEASLLLRQIAWLVHEIEQDLADSTADQAPLTPSGSGAAGKSSIRRGEASQQSLLKQQAEGKSNGGK